MDEIYGRRGSVETPDRIANMRNPLSLADIMKRSKPATMAPVAVSVSQQQEQPSSSITGSLMQAPPHYLGLAGTQRQPLEEPLMADYCDYLMETFQLTRLGTNCNKLLFDGADLNAEVLYLETRNLELEEEVGLLQSAAEMREAEVRSFLAQAPCHGCKRAASCPSMTPPGRAGGQRA